MNDTAQVRIKTYGRWPATGDHITTAGHTWLVTDQGDRVARDAARSYFLVTARRVAKTGRAADWFTAGVEGAV